MKADPKVAAGRAFVRSLNILLKFARLYGFEHTRTIEQLEIAWRELHSAIPVGGDSGLLLGASGAQLLLDGVPLEGSQTEKQFAQLLSAAGLASVQFFPSITQEELGRFTHAFPTGKAKPIELAQQLKVSLEGAQGVRINEICFVATDSRFKEVGVAAQLAAAALGGDQDKFKEWLNDPQKLLELIAAAQGAEGGGPSAAGGFGGGSGGTSVAGAGFQPGGPAMRPAAPDEEEILGLLQTLTSLGQSGGAGHGGVAPGPFQESLAKLPGAAQATLKEALAGLAASAPEGKPDQSVLLRLAEHLAIRFALERYERGEVKVNAVRQMLDRMNQEIENLRKILGAHESKMTDAGVMVESHADILDRQFWAAVPESGKRAVLLSEEAWCIPPRNVRSYVAALIEKGDVAEAINILQNYASCADRDDADARKKTADGLSELAELYGKADPKLLGEALRHLGLRLSVEQDADMQAHVSAAFVRLSQEAATSRCFPAMEQALDLISGVESQKPGVARGVRPKMGIEERIPEFVDEALRARQAAEGMTSVLRQLPQASMEQLATRFNRCQLRSDADHVAELARSVGAEALEYLRGAVRAGPAADAVEMTGILTRLDAFAVEQTLPHRLKDFPRTLQDRAVRQVAGSGAPSRCRILLAMLDHLDPLVMPLVIDEIGVTADRDSLPRLLCIADGDLPAGAGPFLRVKAIEALGRIHAPESIKTLKRIVETKQMWRWSYPHELRIAALQALEKLDPEWTRDFGPKSGIEAEDLALAPLEMQADSRWVRQRRHTRVRFPKPVTAVSTNLQENCRLEIKTASLTGGVAAISRHLPPGTQVQLKMQLGMRSLTATALMRDYRAQDMAFEIVEMNLDERSRFRRLLAGNQGPVAPSPENVEAPAETLVSR